MASITTMGKLKVIEFGENKRRSLAFECPACNCYHAVCVDEGDPKWIFNEDYNIPSFSPSILIDYPDGGRCHLYVRNGNIEYLSDCTHSYKNKTIPLLEIK